jgi:hypothetical protein
VPGAGGIPHGGIDMDILMGSADGFSKFTLLVSEENKDHKRSQAQMALRGLWMRECCVCDG